MSALAVLMHVGCFIETRATCLLILSAQVSKHLSRPLQVESGFFLDCDNKILGKSIRDRVALIKWRRERKVLSGNSEAPEKKAHHDLLQVPGGVAPQPAKGTSECEDQEMGQQRLLCRVPTTTSSTCKTPEVLFAIQPLTGTDPDKNKRHL